MLYDIHCLTFWRFFFISLITVVKSNDYVIIIVIEIEWSNTFYYFTYYEIIRDYRLFERMDGLLTSNSHQVFEDNPIFLCVCVYWILLF